MFSRRVEHVSATKIFAGIQPDGRQALIYSMTITAGEPLAMVLPLPVPADGPDDAVAFVNLEGYSELFTDLKKAFPDQTFYPQSFGRSRGGAVANKTLVVHQVGAFVAWYVPHARDFARLDARFRLPPNVLAALPHYADWGFAVFQLEPANNKPIHPMAMLFPRRYPSAIYFPLTHVHDGAAPRDAAFDHSLYAQLPPLVAALTDWVPSHDRLGKYVDARKAAGLIDGARGGHVKALLGPGPNVDLWLREPVDVRLEDLEGEGPHFRYRVGARYHFANASHPTYPLWLDTARNKLPGLCRGIREALTALTTSHARDWQLGTFHDRLRPYFMNGNQLWGGTNYQNGRWIEHPEGEGLITFRPFSQRVEQQEISLAFATMPDQELAQRINRGLCDMLERIASVA